MKGTDAPVGKDGQEWDKVARPVPPLSWKRLDAYCVKSGVWYVAQVCLRGVWHSELRRDNGTLRGKLLGSFPSSEIAMAYAEAIVTRERRGRRPLG